jgi:diguanylate cyclase (GGDEF)-like protein/PAS domain S-box-containing protein
MRSKNVLTDADSRGQNPQRHFRIPPLFLLYLFLVFALMTTGDYLVQRYMLQRYQTPQLIQTQTGLGTLRAQIESAVTANLQIVGAVAAYISVHPDLTAGEFDRYAQAILRQPNKLANIAAAPDFRVTYVYPVEGNEEILGVDYRELPEQWPDALRAKETGKMTIAGPLRLVQGGTGIIGRVPVYTTIDGQSEFWGLVSSMIDFAALMEEVDVMASDLGLIIAVAKSPSRDDDVASHLWGTARLFDDERSVSMDIILPNSRWQLRGEPEEGWYTAAPESVIIHAVFVVLGFIFLFFLYQKLSSDRELQYSEKRFRDLTLSLSDWIWEIDINGVYTFASGRVFEILGYKPHELLGKTPYFLMQNAEAERIGKIMAPAMQKHEPIRELENWAVSKDGKQVCLLTNAVPILNKKGDLMGYRGVDTDITARKVMQRQLEERTRELERYVAIVDEHVIISQTDLDGIITYASSAFCNISGYTKNELLHQNHNVIRHPDMPDSLYAELWTTITSGRSWNGEFKNLKKDGGYYWVTADLSPLVDKAGNTFGYMAVRHDITDKKRIEELSVTDRLTGLFNRLKLDEVMNQQHERLARYNETYSLIMLDIDHFKSINDSHGHQIGDKVLKEIARLIGANIRKTDVAGRWGGEEFLIICPHTGAEGATATAENLRVGIESHVFQDVSSVTASFGVASYRSGDDPDSLMKRVDDALYQAKRSGRNRVISVPVNE